jgi:peroxiredoxin
MSPHQPVPDVGDRAPDFRLRHTFEADVGLAETLERGPVLVVFYVFDFGGY